MSTCDEEKSTFMEGGQWYKGNLHCHSTISDGQLTVDELIQAYKAEGYDFLATSEHFLFYNGEDKNTRDFILLPSFEYHFKMDDNDYRSYHLNVFAGTDNMLKSAELPMYKNMERQIIHPFSGKSYDVIQKAIDELIGMGCIVMLNHPNWSILELEDILPINNLFALEVYNHSSEHLENMGISRVVWDSLLRRGIRLWGTATDDNHNRFPLQSPRCDSFGGWVTVKAKSLSRNHIIEALLNGSFYSSCGPEIYKFELVGDKVEFDCSHVQRIHLVSDGRQYQTEVCEMGENLLTCFHTKLQGTEKYVRMECADAWGRRAYTNPIYLG
jgi:Predicted metal-dependent phosphoesterases (PHP family)